MINTLNNEAGRELVGFGHGEKVAMADTLRFALEKAPHGEESTKDFVDIRSGMIGRVINRPKYTTASVVVVIFDGLAHIGELYVPRDALRRVS